MNSIRYYRIPTEVAPVPSLIMRIVEPILREQ